MYIIFLTHLFSCRAVKRELVLAAKQTDEKSSAVFKGDYEKAVDEFGGKYVIAHYQPRQTRGLTDRLGWYVGEGNSCSLSKAFCLACNNTSALFIRCSQLTLSLRCLLAVIDIAGNPQFYVQTYTMKKRHDKQRVEHARVQDFSEIYLLERDEETSIAALQKCVQNGVEKNDSIYIHKTNIDSAKLVLEFIKGRTAQIAGRFKPGSIVWAKSGNIWWPARVSVIVFFCIFFSRACTSA